MFKNGRFWLFVLIFDFWIGFFSSVFGNRLLDVFCSEIGLTPCKFTSFSEHSTEGLFFNFCYSLGKSSASSGFLHHLSSSLSESCDLATRHGLILVTNTVVKGASASMERQLFEDIASRLLQLYIAADTWNFSTSTQAAILSRKCTADSPDFHDAGSNLHLYKQQIVELCLLLDGVAVVAQVRIAMFWAAIKKHVIICFLNSTFFYFSNFNQLKKQYKYGSKFIRIWIKIHTNMDQYLYKYGSIFIKIWINIQKNMDQYQYDFELCTVFVFLFNHLNVVII